MATESRFQIPLAVRRILAGLSTAVSCIVVARADGDFKLLNQTESPASAYALGYGIGETKVKPLEPLQMAAPDDAAFDARFEQKLQEANAPVPEHLRNYLVRLRDRHVLAMLPNFEYFPRQNHFNLEVAWSQDEKEGLAIYDFRFGNVAVAWLEPERHRAVDARPEVEQAFRQVLVRREGRVYVRRAHEYSITLLDPVISGRGEFIFGVAHAFIPKKDEEAKEFDYTLKFHVKSQAGRLRFILVKARPGADWEYDQPIKAPEARLEEIYRDLRSRLHGHARVALQREQALWKRRGDGDALSISGRVRELSLRLRAL